MKNRFRGAMVLALALAGCGGSSGSTGSAPPAPAPAPTPAPSPTPTPTATAQALSTYGSPCFVYYHSTSTFIGNDLAAGRFCSRVGEFGANVNTLDGSGFGIFGPFNIDEYYARVFAIDPASGINTIFYGPRGSRVFSPTTSLVLFAGDQAAVKRALGLDNGVFSLVQDRDLTTFNPVQAIASSDPALRAEGERLTAANLRVLAATSLAIRDGGYFPSEPAYTTLGAFISRNPGFIFTNAAMSAYLTERYANRLSPKVISAMAHLINAYAATIPVRVGDETTARQLMLGIHGYLLPELMRLELSNSSTDADAALAVTTQTILNEIQIFLNAQSIPGLGKYFPGPNFAESSTGAITLQADFKAGVVSSFSLVSNDFYVRGTNEGGAGLAPGDAEVTSVTVPAQFASSISAVLAVGSSKELRVTALGGFRGRAYVDYAVTHNSGQTGTARVFLNFR